MKARLRSVRIAPKKANLVAAMVRGLTADEALSSLERTNKKGARILEALLRSALANAKSNDNQDPDALVIKSLVVNKAQAYHRGVPMARGRVRPMRKFLSHIELTLGIAGLDEAPATEAKAEKDEKVTSQPAKKAAQSSRSTTKQSGKGTSSKETAASRPASARATKSKTAAAKKPKAAAAKSKTSSPKKSS